MEPKVGDVVSLPLDTVVLRNRSDLHKIDHVAEYVVESVRHFQPGSEDDHFTLGVVVDLRELAAGSIYDNAMPILTVAISGDFREEYIQPNLEVLYSMRRTFVR